MHIIRQAMAGTLESSDVLVEISPADRISIDLESPVKAQFGDSILATTQEVLRAKGVEGAQVRLQDQGALDCTLRARLEACIARASEEADHA